MVCCLLYCTLYQCICTIQVLLKSFRVFRENSMEMLLPLYLSEGVLAQIEYNQPRAYDCGWTSRASSEYSLTFQIPRIVLRGGRKFSKT